ncbi:MAG TPA: acyl-CoA thioesterase [Marinobacter hydrocarbonoclasticus]|uniref:Acyl-CoA thioester hydrolase n=2 Tax=Marinobacter nauticus TaxID=2743 RepID=A0A350RT68_MARNT|nr:thioesterase family protein [Marinobacter nauticus]MCG8521047.1 acyl-CoA thioesterase [Pseudomonadales bacterium]ABM18674.1 thioesterase superfamily protein [Marinobacter nauticus VT8]MBW3196480.1 acyl-CoA thioesterase [Marinobacter nauticus]MBY6181890.1 acyl-CoA thioesterase [Marinobacter nauticus]MBY6193586.1 acyl-CoA thioesterase [Marinobacter nauticus]|tara:strand:- start:1013 stop:1420 length:408 start_codon:yes stop_codon:yes gene_type:complete
MSVPGNPVSSLAMALRWGDMDAYGHANNTVYFRFFEEARIVWLASLELGGAEDATGPVIIKTSATFLKELTHPANVVVETYADKAGNTSLDTYHLLKDKDTGDIYAEGYAKIVWTDRATRKSTPLPDTLRALAAR